MGEIVTAQTQKSPTPFRASPVTLKQLRELADVWGENRSQVIIRCIERIWWSEIGSQKKHNGNTKEEK